MFDFLKKKEMKIYKIEIPMTADWEKWLWEIYWFPKVFKKFDWKTNISTNSFCEHQYFKLDKDRFSNEEIPSQRLTEDIRDVNFMWAWDYFWVTEKFKQFAEKEKLWLYFLPIKVNWEKRYIMSRQTLPVISDYEVDIENSRYFKWKLMIGNYTVFRSDFIEYYDLQMFSDVIHSDLYITSELKEKFEKEWFIFRYKEEYAVTYKKLDKEKIKEDLLYAREKERELRLTEERKEKYEKWDKILEEVLVEEWNEKLLKKFREEIKWEWKNDFERYEKWEMWPMEKIHFY